jgi:uncharacterized protein
MANGCTSGHGVCGLGRLSKRSLVAVVCFLFTAIGVSSFLSYGGYLKRNGSIEVNLDGVRDSILIICLAVVILISNSVYHYLTNKPLHRLDECIVGFVVGCIFSAGLVISGMIRRGKVLAFLDFSNGLQAWDPSLAFVLGCAVLPNIFSFYFIS